ncbi:CHAT domain-containing protein [Nocardia cyriacigeorgica]|uniref:CHAT domain-containing protein n=1 Tax=Nocardia cyriacigeorgica TaxID=135487 RepID=UPI002457F150|nr:CHAT domain-containing protein [Nocardia cyriacigeorgica]
MLDSMPIPAAAEAATESQEIITRVITAYETNKDAYANTHFESKNSALEIAVRLLGRADTAQGTHLTPEQAIRMAELYGRCAGIAKRYGIYDNELLSESRLGQILKCLIVPNRDEARQRGADLLERCATEYLRIRNRSAAGIELTNASLLVLEMHNPSHAQLTRARQLLERGKSLKKEGTVDWAYSEANIGLCERMLAQSDPEKLKLAHKRFRNAERVFQRHGQGESFEYYLLSNTAEILIDWWESVKKRNIKKLVLSNLDNVPDPYRDTARSEPVLTYSALRSNPAAFGFESIPEWLNSPVDPTSIDKELFKPGSVLERMKSELSRYGSGSAEYAHLSWKAYELDASILGHTQPSEHLLRILISTFERGEVELFFIRARKLVGQCPGHPEDYHRILILLCRSLQYFRNKWSESDIERFLRRNPVSFRFIACELAEREDWHWSFQVLEHSRGLTSGRMIRYRDIPEVSDPQRVWMHLTHSPKATYCIARYFDGTGEKTVGEGFASLSGAKLAELFSSYDGLLSAQLRTAPGATRAAVRKILDATEPLSQWIIRTAGEREPTILPGGYYQSFPIATQVYLESLTRSTDVRAVIAPSLTACSNNWRADSATIHELGICSAHDVPGTAVLFWAQQEEAAIRAAVPELNCSTITGTSVDLVNEIGNLDVIHFSGHSRADAEPLDSSVFLHGGTLSVREILELDLNLHACILSSCQSGLPLNFDRQDEHLSLQSAFFYAGTTMVIGTLWPVRDIVAFTFGLLMYRSLPEWSYDLESAFFTAIRRLQKLTVRELKTLLAELGIEPPESVGAVEATDTIVFPDFYDHGAYTLMAARRS